MKSLWIFSISQRFNANEVAMAAVAKQPLSDKDGEEFGAKEFAGNFS